MLDLAAAAPVARVMGTGRWNSRRRWSDDASECSAREMTFARNLRRHDVPRCSARNEHDEAIRSPHTITSGADRIDPYADARH